MIVRVFSLSIVLCVLLAGACGGTSSIPDGDLDDDRLDAEDRIETELDRDDQPETEGEGDAGDGVLVEGDREPGDQEGPDRCAGLCTLAAGCGLLRSGGDLGGDENSCAAACGFGHWPETCFDPTGCDALLACLPGCTPGAALCEGNRRWVCANDGSGWEHQTDCAAIPSCAAGGCRISDGACVATASPGYCYIGGRCYPDGRKNPEQRECSVCDTVSASDRWTPVNESAACDDGNAQTFDDSCIGGICRGGGCQCTDGSCCDGCRFLTNATVCGPRSEPRFACPDGEVCGGELVSRRFDRHCSGNDDGCNGPIQPATPWSTVETCEAGTRCSVALAACLPDIDCPPPADGDDDPDAEPEIELSGCPAWATTCAARLAACFPGGRSWSGCQTDVNPDGSPRSTRLTFDDGAWWRFFPDGYSFEAAGPGGTFCWRLFLDLAGHAGALTWVHLDAANRRLCTAWAGEHLVGVEEPSGTTSYFSRDDLEQGCPGWRWPPWYVPEPSLASPEGQACLMPPRPDGDIGPDGDQEQPPAVAVDWRQVAGSAFWMGCAPNDSECGGAEVPYHRVTVPSLSAMRNETTVAQFAACVAAGGCHTPWFRTAADDPACLYGRNGASGHPMNCVSWEGAQEFCSWIGGRLPSEAEWEFLCRGASTASAGRLHPWGDAAPDGTRCVFNGAAIAPGCSKSPAGDSPSGLCDMAGNAMEWVSDPWHSGYSGAPTDGSVWVAGGDERQRVVRGGSHRSTSWSVRCSMRDRLYDTFRDPVVGFRCVR